MQERIQSITDRLASLQERLGSGNITEEQRQQILPQAQEMKSIVANLRERDFSELLNTDSIPTLDVPDVGGSEMTSLIAAQGIRLPAEEQLAKMADNREAQLGVDKESLIAARQERTRLGQEATDVMRDVDMEGFLRGELGRQVDPLTDKQMQSIESTRALQMQLTQIQSERAGALGAIGQMNVSTPFLTGMQNRVAQSYDRREANIMAQIGTESAYLQALSGMKAEARAQVSMLADAYTYDTEMELRAIETLMNVKQAEIAELDRDVQNAMQEQQRYWENQLQWERQQYTTVLDRMIEFPEAGIKPTDSLEDMATKVSSWLGMQPDARVEGLAEQFPFLDIKPTDSYWDAINKIGEYQQSLPPDAPELFGGQDTGYFTWQYDGDGNWRAVQVIGGKSVGAAKPITARDGDRTLQWDPSTNTWRPISASGESLSTDARMTLENPHHFLTLNDNQQRDVNRELWNAGYLKDTAPEAYRLAVMDDVVRKYNEGRDRFIRNFIKEHGRPPTAVATTDGNKANAVNNAIDRRWRNEMSPLRDIITPVPLPSFIDRVKGAINPNWTTKQKEVVAAQEVAREMKERHGIDLLENTTRRTITAVKRDPRANELLQQALNAVK